MTSDVPFGVTQLTIAEIAAGRNSRGKTWSVLTSARSPNEINDDLRQLFAFVFL